MDAGPKHLRELKTLRSLQLYWTKVTDAGLPDLKELKGLRSLSLGVTEVTDAGQKELKAALPDCTITGMPSSGQSKEPAAKAMRTAAHRPALVALLAVAVVALPALWGRRVRSSRRRVPAAFLTDSK